MIPFRIPVIACLAAGDGSPTIRIPPEEAYRFRESHFCSTCSAQAPCNAFALTQPKHWPHGYSFVWCKAAAHDKPYTAERMLLREAAKSYNGGAGCVNCHPRLKANCNQLAEPMIDLMVYQYSAEELLGDD